MAPWHKVVAEAVPSGWGAPPGSGGRLPQIGATESRPGTAAPLRHLRRARKTARAPLGGASIGSVPVGVVSPVLVGRDAELRRLREAIARTVDGGSGVVLVGGEAGVGKSRLLQAALSEGAGEGVRVLTGGCIELGGEGLPFVPLVEALRALVRATSAADLDRLLGPARAELGRLLPE